MTEFAEVTVKLPKLPEGWEWYADDDPFTYAVGDPKVAHLYSHTRVFHTRPIKPATVTVTLRREDAVDLQNLLGGFQPEIYGRVVQACKAALGEEKPYEAKCGRQLHPLQAGVGWLECTYKENHKTKPCGLPIDHAGNHAPESLP